TDARADAAGAAGDEHHLVLQAQVHRAPFPLTGYEAAATTATPGTAEHAACAAAAARVAWTRHGPAPPGAGRPADRTRRTPPPMSTTTGHAALPAPPAPPDRPCPPRPVPSYWLWGLCLLGVDYFSTLAYQPSTTFHVPGPP